MRQAGVIGRRSNQVSGSGIIASVRRDLVVSSRFLSASSKSKTEPTELVGTHGQGIAEDERCNTKVCPT